MKTAQELAGEMCGECNGDGIDGSREYCKACNGTGKERKIKTNPTLSDGFDRIAAENKSTTTELHPIFAEMFANMGFPSGKIETTKACHECSGKGKLYMRLRNDEYEEYQCDHCGGCGKESA